MVDAGEYLVCNAVQTRKSKEALPKLENIIQYRRLRWLGYLSRMDHHRSHDKLSNGNPIVSGGGQVDCDRTGNMSSRKISGKWASAGTRFKRLQR